MRDDFILYCKCAYVCILELILLIFMIIISGWYSTSIPLHSVYAWNVYGMVYVYLQHCIVSCAASKEEVRQWSLWLPLSLWTASQCQERNQPLNVSMYNHACFQDLHMKKDHWHKQQDMDVLMLKVVLKNHSLILRDNSIVQSSECWCCNSNFFPVFNVWAVKG